MLPFNGQSHSIEAVNSHLLLLTKNPKPLLLTGEKGVGKHHAATWLQLQNGNKPFKVVIISSLTELTNAIASNDCILIENDTPLAITEIATQQIFIPPLRDRVIDIPLIAIAVAKDLACELNLPVPSLSEQYLLELQWKPWLGNVAEMKKFIKETVF